MLEFAQNVSKSKLKSLLFRAVILHWVAAHFIGGNMNVTTVLPVLQTILAFCNICILGYALFRFLNKPHNTLEERVNAHDIEIREIKASLLQGNDRFRDQDDTNEVLIRSVLALVEFEMQYCLTEKKPMSNGLEKAKESLDNYLAKK